MVNYPSIKSLRCIPDSDAPLARQILVAKNRDALRQLREKYSSKFASNDAWLNQCYNPPSFHHVKMKMLDIALRTAGVEYIPAGRGARSPSIEYCNAGDTYTIILLFVNGRYRVGCLGDIVERGKYD